MKRMYVPIHVSSNGRIEQWIKSGYRLDGTWATVETERGWSLTHISSGLRLGLAATIRELKTIIPMIDMTIVNTVISELDANGLPCKNTDAQTALRAMFANLREFGLYH